MVGGGPIIGNSREWLDMDHDHQTGLKRAAATHVAPVIGRLHPASFPSLFCAFASSTRPTKAGTCWTHSRRPRGICWADDVHERDSAVLPARLARRACTQRCSICWSIRQRRIWPRAVFDQALRRRAAVHGHSMEEEVRQILRQVVEPTKPAATKEGLGTRIHNHFARLGGLELELPSRNDTPTAESFEL